MTDKELKDNIIKILQKSSNPLTLNQIQGRIKLNKDYWRIAAIIDQLTLFGIIKITEEPFKPNKYEYINPA